ncbi:50S ribosomal protein L4 [candidate division CPR3 bacterium 4484_211]|uniref:Large ribosomal subunit protein uL4 n=1 Tax=candidate division CPR3 bacterium 4484_211 TaxID=1968527 RepID=A0A1W9NZS0_UNCC3|nr:MAG: 50S ribosomal protein L4 [candidate division CPR3 bacterium 4484_211]
MQVDVFDQKGKKKGKVELNPSIFEAKINRALMAQAVRVRLANKRLGTVKTKSRGEVRGGGKKPWRQKGTGRARHGSRRSPIWVGGGHAHPKRPRDFSLEIPKKMKRLALFSALSLQLKENRLVIVDKMDLKEISTKTAAGIFNNLSKGEKALFVLPKANEIVEKSFKNLPQARTLEARLLNTYDVLNCKKLVVLKAALNEIEKVFLNKRDG